jgi:hypothetical protein
MRYAAAVIQEELLNKHGWVAPNGLKAKVLAKTVLSGLLRETLDFEGIVDIQCLLLHVDGCDSAVHGH